MNVYTLCSFISLYPQEPEQKCWQEPREECWDETTKVARKVCEQPKW